MVTCWKLKILKCSGKCNWILMFVLILIDLFEVKLAFNLR
jgi:hypothetical protein